MPGRTLEIGLNDKCEIVINFDTQDEAHIWHAVFTVQEARGLANKLLKFADEAMQKSRGETVGGIGR